MTAPYDWPEAKAAINQAKAQQQASEQHVRDAYKQFAQAEKTYRLALAKRIVELRADGQPVTVCQDLAKGDPHVADLRYRRDVAEGVREAAQQASYRHSADRRDLEQLVDWSKRRELAEGSGMQPQWTKAVA